ncbi:MAG: molybdopterin-binding protein [Candidatus Promineifilaceae bacterium]|nr:molybdopterin-binding protein [Candidatus Promineifilaceae bacterium]
MGHNITDHNGRRALRKGKPLTAADIQILRDLGHKMVYVAELEAGDIDENGAALRVVEAVMGANLRFSGPATGRANLFAQVLGLLRVDTHRLSQLNSQPGITLATLHNNTAVHNGKMVGTVKIIPYAVPYASVSAVESIGASEPLIYLDPLEEKRVTAIFSGSLSAQERIINSFEPALRRRFERLGSRLQSVHFIPLEDEPGEKALAVRLEQEAEAGCDFIILAGETAIMDAQDIAPRAVQQAGGIVTCFGVPVDPGNLMMLAYIDDIPVLGAPGCVRSPKTNIVDQVLPRLLAGDRLTQADIVAMGHGGLLEDINERPYPRSKIK